MLPTATMLIVFAPLSVRLVGCVGARRSMVAGGLAVLASGLMLTGLAPGSSVPFVLSAYAVSGFGFAALQSPHGGVGTPPAQAGVAVTSRQAGITLGVAVLGAVAGSGVATRPG